LCWELQAGASHEFRVAARRGRDRVRRRPSESCDQFPAPQILHIYAIAICCGSVNFSPLFLEDISFGESTFFQALQSHFMDLSYYGIFFQYKEAMDLLPQRWA